MQIITWLNHKGGVGKTTFAYHSAIGLAALGHKVLLVDADGQGSATLACGLPKSPGFYDLFVRNADFAEVIRVVEQDKYLPVGVLPPQDGFLWVVPGNAETMNVDPLLNSRDVRDRLRDLENDVDVVIVDTSPTPSKLHAGIYLATDYIIHPTELEFLSTDGLLESIRYTQAAQGFRLDYGIANLKVMGIVPNKYRANTINHTENLKKLCSTFGELVWEPIALATAWPDAGLLRQPVFKSDPSSRAASECWGMIDRIDEVLKNGK